MKLGSSLANWIRSGVSPSELEIQELERLFNNIQLNNLAAENWPTDTRIDFHDVEQYVGDRIVAQGLGTMAVQDNTAVNIDGGTINGITDLAIADGGTGASTAATARTALGVDILHLPAGANLTIATGVITITHSLHGVDVQTGASDDLDTINGSPAVGDILILHTISSDRDVTVKDVTGNIYLAGDCVLGTIRDTLTLVYSWGANWVELSRSING